MFKTLIYSVALVLLSSTAYASKARLQALSQGENGSYYIDDKRNVFLNPAKAYRYGKWSNFEWGESNQPPTTSSYPNAEGGLFYTTGSSYLGVQLGRESNAQVRMAAASTAIGLTGTSAFLYPKDTVNLIFATNGNVRWGLQALYGYAQDRSEETTPGVTTYPNRKASTLEIGAGAEADHFDIYTKFDLAYSSEIEETSTNTIKLDGKATIVLGGSYVLNEDAKIFGAASSGGYDVTSTNNATKKEGKVFTLTLGYAHYLNPEAATRFYVSPAFEMRNLKVKDGNGGIDEGSDSQSIPLTIGMENAANEWLTLRASVSQRVLLNQTNTTVIDKHHENSTVVGAGAGITWKKLTLDGTLRGAMDTGSGQIDGNNLLANVGMTYLF